MGRLQGNTEPVYAALLQVVFQTPPTHGAVGLQQDAVGLVNPFDGPFGFLVADAHRMDMAAHRLPVGIAVDHAVPVHRPAIEVEETGQVAGVTHIHGVGKAGPGRRDLGVAPRGEKPGKLVVFVGGHNQHPDRQAHATGVFAPQGVAEISRGNGKDDLLSRRRQLGIGIDIIDRLREDSPEIDGIGRGKIQIRQGGIGKGLLHHVLAIVEFPRHGHRLDVLPDGVQLLFLAPADLVPRVENRHADPRHALEGLADGASRIPRGGHQDVEPFIRIPHYAHQPGHHPGGKILERSRGSLIEAQDISFPHHPFQGDGEIIGVHHHPA